MLATYESDDLGALYHYCRGMLVREPFKTAGDNMSAMFARVLARSGSLSVDAQLAPLLDEVWWCLRNGREGGWVRVRWSFGR